MFTPHQALDMGEASILVFWVIMTSHTQVIMTLAWLDNPIPEDPAWKQGSTYSRYGLRKEKG